MINIVTFKWKKVVSQTGGYDLPMAIDQYTSNHVNILYKSIKRNTTLDFRFTCVTDDPEGLLPDIEYVPLWDKCQSLGGCYNRLYVFSKDMKNILGDRFMCIDLDVVILRNIDHILSRKEDFIINQYGTDQTLLRREKKQEGGYRQYYNGGLFIMNAGARSQVWDDFEFEKTDQILSKFRENKLFPKGSKQRKQYSLVGSDQAWISYKLGKGESMFVRDKDYVYPVNLENLYNVPKECAIMFFAGAKDPSKYINKISWVKDNWRL